MKRKGLLLSLMIALVFVLAMAAPAMAAPSFNDIDGCPYESSIKGLAAWGIAGGYDDGAFRPDNPLWRAQFAKMAVLAMGYPVTVADVSPFLDTPEASATNPLYPGAYAAVANTNGIILGYPGNIFGFYDNVTRQQTLSVIVRAAGSAFADAPSGTWTGVADWSDPTHGANIQKAEWNGLLAGIANLHSWDPAADATRGEAAEFVFALLKKTGSLETGSSGACKVSGMIDLPVGLTIPRLEAMGLITATLTHPKGGDREYTGVLFSRVLNALGVKSSATNMVAVASDGFSATIPIADIHATAMLAVDSGQLNLAMPELSTKAWVKDVVSLEFN